MTRDEAAVIACMEQGCESWRRGDDYEGLGHFQEGCLLWLDQLEASSEGGTYAGRVEIVAALQHHMEEVWVSLQNRDTIRATDVLEYDILPLLRGEEVGEP